MTTVFVAPALQACTFALGCALIHAARGHAVLLTRLLVVAAAVAAALLLVVASLDCAPDEGMALDEVTVYAAF